MNTEELLTLSNYRAIKEWTLWFALQQLAKREFSQQDLAAIAESFSAFRKKRKNNKSLRAKKPHPFLTYYYTDLSKALATRTLPQVEDSYLKKVIAVSRNS